jgi:hypothetical protein
MCEAGAKVNVMSAGSGLLTLLVRLVSGRLLHEIGSYARREVRLVAVAVVGLVGFVTFLLGATAIAVVLLYTVLAARIGPPASFAILIGATLAVALACLLIAMHAAKAVTRWQGADPRTMATPVPVRRSARDDDAAIVLLISAILEKLVPGSRRASR